MEMLPQTGGERQNKGQISKEVQNRASMRTPVNSKADKTEEMFEKLWWERFR